MNNFDPLAYTYLDYAATAPLCPEAAEAMAPYLVPGKANLALGGNANSLNSPGRAAFAAMEQARKQLAAAIGAARPQEVVFTSGATEADNAALFGLARAAREKLRLAGKGDVQPRVLVSAIEHDAVLAPARALAAEGFAVEYLPPNRRGFIGVETLQAALGPDVVLVSVQAANSEVGSVMEIAQLAEAAHEAGALFHTDAVTLQAALGPDVVLVSVQAANSEVGSVMEIAQLAEAAHEAGALFHTDAVQAFGKVAVDVGQMKVDAASFSAHKIGGPKGIGCLYLKARTPFAPFLLGGGQENGLRSSTQNVAAMAGFAAAAQVAQATQVAEEQRLRELRDFLYAQMTALQGVRATVEVAPGSGSYLPNIVHLLVGDLESQTMILRFDMLGFGVSGGSACSSQSLEPSHVLRAMGVSADDAQGALRISMGRFTTEEDVRRFAEAARKVLEW